MICILFFISDFCEFLVVVDELWFLLSISWVVYILEYERKVIYFEIEFLGCVVFEGDEKGSEFFMFCVCV